MAVQTAAALEKGVPRYQPWRRVYPGTAVTQHRLFASASGLGSVSHSLLLVVYTRQRSSTGSKLLQTGPAVGWPGAPVPRATSLGVSGGSSRRGSLGA